MLNDRDRAVKEDDVIRSGTRALESMDMERAHGNRLKPVQRVVSQLKKAQASPATKALYGITMSAWVDMLGSGTF